MSQELKPCPFCGSDTVDYLKLSPTCWTVACGPCETEGPAASTSEEAAETWNKRAQPAGEAVIAEWQSRYMGDPRQPGFWENVKRDAHEWAAKTYARPGHITESGWEVRPLYAAPPAAANQAGIPEGIDYSLTRGDIAYSPRWGDGRAPVEVVDVNWALRAIAVKLAPNGGIVVWPAASLTRTAAPHPTESHALGGDGE